MTCNIDSVSIDFTRLASGVVIEYIEVPEDRRGQGVAKATIFKLLGILSLPRAYFCPTAQSIKRITGLPPTVKLGDGRTMFVIGEAPTNPLPPLELSHSDSDGELYMQYVSEGVENALVHYIRDRSHFWDYYEHQARLLEDTSTD